MNQARYILLLILLIPAFSWARTGTNPGIRFIENKGQWPDQVEYAADIPGGRVFLTKTGMTYSFYDPELPNMLHAHGDDSEHDSGSSELELKREAAKRYIKMHAFNMQFKNADIPGLHMFEGRAYDTRYNFFNNDDPSTWGEEARAFNAIEYNDLYECVDVQVFTEGDWLKYDVIVNPGAQVEDIKMVYDGLSNLQLKEGRLHIKTSLNEIIESIPYAYQIIDGDTIAVDTNYKLLGNEVSFDFPCDYDKNHRLIIDPLLIFSTFSGSTADNFGYTAAFDNDGNLYSGGIVFSQGFPTTTGAFQENYSDGLIDIGILKFDSAGSRLIYATYLGGNGDESPHSLVVNDNNELIVFGSTSSSNFPTTPGAFDTSFNGGTTNPNLLGFLPYLNGSDIFISKLNATGGSLLSSTLVGGTNDDGVILDGARLQQNYGDQFKGDVNVDEFGNIYVATTTRSTDFFNNASVSTVTLDGNLGGISDAIVFKMSSNLSNMIWGTYLGGGGEDAAYSVKFDAEKNVYVGGGTVFMGTPFPTTAGSLNENPVGGTDGFVTKISASGDRILNSTFLGTTLYDQAYFLDLDSQEEVYVFGQTRGPYPIIGNVYNNANSGQFIHKLTNNLDSTIFSTVFGSGTPEPNISPTAFLVNECDNLYLSGWGGDVNNANSNNTGNTNGMPTTANAFSRTTDGSDFYLMSLSSDGSQLLYGTFYGSTNNGGDHVDGGTSRFDKRGIVYQSVCSCGGSVDDFPTTPGAFSSVNRGVSVAGMERCNNAVFKFDIASLRADFQTNTADFSSPGITQVCFPDEIILQNQSVGGERYEWDFGDGTGLVRTDTTFIRHTYLQPGLYTIKLVAIDLNTCIGIDSTFKQINVFDPPFVVGNNGVICEEDSYLLTASGAERYTWSDVDGNVISNNANFEVTPPESTVFFVDLFNQGCELRDSIRVDVIPLLRVDVQVNSIDFENPGTDGVCFRDSIAFENLSVVAEQFEWNLGDGTVILRNDKSPIKHLYTAPGVYTVTLRSLDVKPCIGNDIDQVQVNVVQPAFSVVDDGTICEGDSYQLQAFGAGDYLWTDQNDSIVSTSSSVVVTPSVSTRYFVDLNQNGCMDRDTVDVTVIPEVDVQFEIEKINDCFDLPVYRLKNVSSEADRFEWNFGDGETSEETELIYDYDQQGTFTITLTGFRGFCEFTQSVTVDVFELKVPNVFTPGAADGDNDTFIVKSREPVRLKILNRWGKLIYESAEYTDQWDGEDYPAGVYYYEVTTKEDFICKSWLHLIR